MSHTTDQLANVMPSATPTEAVEWLLHPPSESVPIARWPAVPNFVYTQAKTLPAPDLADLNAQPAHQPLLPRRTMAQADVAATLPVPDRDLFAIPEGSIEVLLSTTLSRRVATRLAMAAETPHASKGKAGKSPGRRTAHGAPKHAAQTTGATPHPTRVASLKKRTQ